MPYQRKQQKEGLGYLRLMALRVSESPGNQKDRNRIVIRAIFDQVDFQQPYWLYIIESGFTGKDKKISKQRRKGTSFNWKKRKIDQDAKINVRTTRSRRWQKGGVETDP